MNVLSLFAGIGGLDLGLERAGMTVVGQVEIDPFCQRVLAKHWPEVPRHDDVRTAVDWWLDRARPAVDVVCGGFPCQPVSVAGRCRAQEDERWLWPAAWAVIRDLRPRFAILENVPGLLARGMGDVLGDLAAIGYDAEWDCIPAAAVGAPHRRDRVFVVAHSDNARGWRFQSEPEPGSSPSAEPVQDGPHRDVADARSFGPDRWPGQQGAGREEAIRKQAGDHARHGSGAPRVADTDSARQSKSGRVSEFGWGRPTDCGWWSAEPDVGRVAHGVPRRVDRLRALGNAVVPQVAEHVGRLVMAVGCG